MAVWVWNDEDRESGSLRASARGGLATGFEASKAISLQIIWLRFNHPHQLSRSVIRLVCIDDGQIRTTLHCSAEFRVALLTENDPVLSLVVWTLKREVRAIRGCLGMYRR